MFTRIQEFIEPRVRELLVIEDDAAEQMSIAALIGAYDIRISTRRQRRARRSNCCATQKFDCVILDLKLPDISGFELLSEIQRDERLREMPIVVFTGPRAHRTRKRAELRRRAKSIVLKGVQSPERLLDETALFLHRDVIATCPKPSSA